MSPKRKPTCRKTSPRRKPSLPSIPDALKYFDSLPDSAYIRLRILCSLRGESAATIWRRVAAGAIPPPKKLGPNVTAWNVGQLRAAMRAQELV
jgi:predicted DNA-binding transcriptional regulator AlpA